MVRILFEDADVNGLILTVFEPMRDGTVLQVEDAFGNVMYFKGTQAKQIAEAINQATKSD